MREKFASATSLLFSSNNQKRKHRHDQHNKFLAAAIGIKAEAEANTAVVLHVNWELNANWEARNLKK